MENTLKFGTSGVRGLVTSFTDQEVFLLTNAFLIYAKTIDNIERVYTARDLRQSSPHIEVSCQQAIHEFSQGIKITTCGVSSTPALSYFAKGFHAIMITGSHIPADRNGIKFYLPTGETLKHDDEKIFEIYLKLKTEKVGVSLFSPDGTRIHAPKMEVQDASREIEDYFEKRYTSFFSSNSLAGLKVLFYQHSSAGRDLFPRILEKLGAEVVAVGRAEKFIPVDTEAVESIDQFKSWIHEYKVDALVSTDGDADRPLVIGKNGSLIQGDKLGLLTSLFLKMDAIAMPVSCNSGIANTKELKEVLLTKIGSPYVISGMQKLTEKYKKVGGFEANGGYLLQSDIKNQSGTLESLPTRDSLLPIICVLAWGVKNKSSIPELLCRYLQSETSSILVRNCPAVVSASILHEAMQAPEQLLARLKIPTSTKVRNLNTLDGARIETDKGEIFHFRPSGNAPELRCYIEAANEILAQEYATKVFEGLSQIVKKWQTATS